MSDSKDQKEVILQEVRSILLSSQGGLTSREFVKDWQLLLGYPLPFRKLGFSSLEDFFRSIPDVVEISFNRDGELVLKAVATESTAHIARMVARQRPAKKKSSGKGGGRGRPPPRFQPRYSSGPSHHTVHRSSPTVPAIMRGRIQDLLYAYPGGLLGSNFCVAYNKRYGVDIIHSKLGFSSMLDLLQSLSDFVVLEQLPSGGFKVYARGSKLARHFQGDDTRRPEKPPRNLPPRFQNRQQNTSRYQELGFQDEYDDGGSDEFDFGDPSEENEGHRAEASGGAEVSNKHQAKAPADEDNSVIPPHVKAAVQKVIARFPYGIRNTRFSTEFKAIMGQPLPYKELGFNSVIELMGMLPDIVAIQRHSARDWLLFDPNKPLSQHSPTRSEPTEKPSKKTPSPRAKKTLPFVTAPPISDRLRETVRQISLQYPDGLPLGEFEKTYQVLTGEPLALKNLGYVSTDALLVQLTDVIHMEYQGEGSVMLYPVETGKPYREDFLVKKLSQQEGSHGVPQDAVGPGCSYRPLPFKAESQGYIEVFVSNVDSPSRIWVQVAGVNTTDALENLMDRLDNCYNHPNAEAYTMPSSLIQVGLVCAALFPEDNNWHRVTITALKDSDFVEVYYVDYGSTCCVTKSSLRLLRSRFLQLPAMALRARLANIQPSDRIRWSKAARKHLLALVSNKKLQALVTNVDKNGIVSLCLCDVSGLNDVHINDALVQAHYAVIVPDEEDMPMAHDLASNLLGASEVPSTLEQHGFPEDSQTHVSAETPATAALDVKNVPSHETISTADTGYVEGIITNIKLVQLTETYSIHIIRHNGKAWISSAEISALLWKKDLLRSMLRQKKMVLDKLVLPQDENRDLFEEFRQYQIPGTIEDNSSELKTHVTLYPLSSVPEILELFAHPSTELREAATRQVQGFDPNDPYWKGELTSEELNEDEEDEDEEEDDEEGELSVKELEIALNMLQLKRKKAIQKMQEMDATNSGEYVEELVKVEEQLRMIKERIEQANNAEKRSEAASVKSGCSTSSHLTQEDQVISHVITEQNDGYTHANQVLSPKRADIQLPMGGGSALKADIKTNPVAPMLATPQQMQPQEPTTVVPGMDFAATNSNLQQQGATGGAAAVMDPSQQQMLLQYQQMLMNQMAALQSLMTGTGTGASLPSMPLMNPQLGTMMPPQPGFPQAGFAFNQPVSSSPIDFNLMNPALQASVSSPAEGYGQVFDMRGRGRGGAAGTVSPSGPGGLQNKPS